MLKTIMTSLGAFGGCLVITIIAILFFCLTPYLFKLLWNWIMPYLFHLPHITFWMSFGIVLFLGIIGGLLFKKGD